MIEEIEQRQLSLDSINGIQLSEFKKRKIAVEIYSEVLNENIWFCSNEEIADQVRRDDPSAICYTTSEIKELIELDPDKDLLRKIHDVKSVFEDSRIIKTKNITAED